MPLVTALLISPHQRGKKSACHRDRLLVAAAYPVKEGRGCSLSSKTSPFFPTFIVSPPVYLHTVFLDDFFRCSFPYTQAETTPVLRTCGESSPLSKDTSRVCAQINTCFIRRVPDPRRVRKGALRAITASWGCTRLVQYSG